ncbi:MAG: hypothetical protein RLZZ444_3198 [Pseudomonadota bacterium]
MRPSLADRLAADEAALPFDPLDFDPALLYEPPPGLRGDCSARAGLETKAVQDRDQSPAEELISLLGEMRAEMRAQFAGFKEIRLAAERVLAEGEEADAKLAKADLKAANEGLTQLVRMFEKIDSLQRSLVRDVEEAGERMVDNRSIDELVASLQSRIEARLAERQAASAGVADWAARAGDGIVTAPAPT